MLILDTDPYETRGTSPEARARYRAPPSEHVMTVEVTRLAGWSFATRSTCHRSQFSSFDFGSLWRNEKPEKESDDKSCALQIGLRSHLCKRQEARIEMARFQWNHGERNSRPPRWLIAACAVAGLVAMLAYRTTRPVVDLDLWHEMALAREIVQLGYVPRADDFAYTPTVEPVVHHEWGAGMIAYGLANTLGASGILLLKLLLIAALAAACWTCARRRGAGLPLLSCLAPFAILLVDEGFSTVRAQMYSFVGLAVLLVFLDRDRAGHRRWLFAWLPLFVLWLNLHAGFLVGAGLFAVHWLEQLLRRQPHWHLLLTGLVMMALIGINPYGLSYYAYLLHGVTASRPHVSEWRPLWEAAPAKIAFVCVHLVGAGLRNLAKRLDPFGRFAIDRDHGSGRVAVQAVLAVLRDRVVLLCARLPGKHAGGLGDSQAVVPPPTVAGGFLVRPDAGDDRPGDQDGAVATGRPRRTHAAAGFDPVLSGRGRRLSPTAPVPWQPADAV